MDGLAAHQIPPHNRALLRKTSMTPTTSNANDLHPRVTVITGRPGTGKSVHLGVLSRLYGLKLCEPAKNQQVLEVSDEDCKTGVAIDELPQWDGDSVRAALKKLNKHKSKIVLVSQDIRDFDHVLDLLPKNTLRLETSRLRGERDA